MGMPLPGKPEISDNAASEGQDRPKRTSMDSPKSAQPSCLRGGFIRLFLKRTEQDMSSEDAASSNQSTEDKHGGRGKKRKAVSGNIFRLPCLRPAERIDTGEQTNAQVNKVDEQGNQAIPEEELKPYSKASFLRKIRGYRLMRERDATEKEKVIEMEQCKEGSLVEEHNERTLELDGKITKPKQNENTLGEKRNALGEKGSQEDTLEKSKILEQERKEELSTDHGDSFREQDSNEKHLKDQEKTVDKMDHCEMDKGFIRNDVEVNQTKNVLEKDLQEQVNQAGREKGQKEEDILDHESLTETVEQLGSKVTKQETTGAPDPGNSNENQEMNSQRVHGLEDDLPPRSNRAEDVVNGFPENGLITEKAKKLTDHLKEHPEKNTGDVSKCSPKQHSNEGGVKRCNVLEEGAIQVVIDQKGHAEISEDTQKKEDKLEEFIEKLYEDKGQEENLEALQNSLLAKKDQESEDHVAEEENNANNVEESENHPQKQNIPTEKVSEAKDYTVDQYSHIQKEEDAKDNFQEQDSHMLEPEKENDHIEKTVKTNDHVLEQVSHLPKEVKAGDQFTEEDSHIQKEGTTGDQFLEKNNNLQKEGNRGDHFQEEASHIQKKGKGGDQFLEDDHHIQKEENQGHQFLEEDNYKQKERKAEDCILEEKHHVLKEGKSEDKFPEQEKHLCKLRKPEDHFIEQESHIQTLEDVSDCLQAIKSNTENVGEPEALVIKQESHLGKGDAQIITQDILSEEKGHLLEEINCVKKCKGLGKVFPIEVKDKSVQQEILMTCTTATRRSEEPCTEFSTFLKQESATTVDLNYYPQEGRQEDINDSDDDDDLMDDTEWRSLQVEVKGMVQWLVEEASDRLTCFSQESEGTE